MRPIIFNLFLVAAIALTACQSPSLTPTTTREGRWSDMWTDITLRHRYERYLNRYDSMPGFERVSTRHRRPGHHATVKATTTQPAAPVANDQSQQALEIRDLRQRISALEQGLTYDVDARNKSLEQINALTAQLNTLIRALNGAAAQHTPAPTPPPGTIKIPGNN